MKRKKALWVLMAVCLAAVCVLTACGDESGKVSDTGTGDRLGTLEGFYLTVAGVDVAPGMLLPKMPEADNVFSAASCAIEGYDRTYTYGSVVITTEDDGKTERITSLTLMDDGASTREGVTIGDSAERVTAVYGTSEEQTGTAVRYRRGQVVLKFLLRDGVVTSVIYALAE